MRRGGDLMPVVYEPFAPGFRRDPYPVYRELRERAPLHFAPESNAWCVSRYEDVMHVLRSPELFSSRAMFTVMMNGGKEGMPPISWDMLRMMFLFLFRTGMNPLSFTRARTLIASDPPVHGGMRRLVNRGFTPRRIADWEPRMRAVVDAQLAGLRHGDAFDLVRDLAVPLPVTIIAEMLGVDPARQADFKRWSDAFVEGATGAGRAHPFAREFTDSFVELAQFVRGVVKARRRAPADDLVSAILADDDDSEPLTDLEVVAFVQLLMVAGNETTTNLLGNAVRALLAHPAELARVRTDLARVPGLVEETLRFDAPIQMIFRTARRDVDVAGGRIPAGATVVVLLGSANRDERRFPEPDRFDIGRDTAGHLGFGFGNHFCLGASLARLEARVALEALVPELVRLEPVDSEPELVDSFLVRGPRRLALRRAA